MFLNLLFIKCPIYLDFHKFVSRIENFNCFADLIIWNFSGVKILRFNDYPPMIIQFYFDAAHN